MRKELKLLLKEAKPHIRELVAKEVQSQMLPHVKKATKDMAIKFFDAIKDFNNKLEEVIERKIQRLFKKHNNLKEE